MQGKEEYHKRRDQEENETENSSYQNTRDRYQK